MDPIPNPFYHRRAQKGRRLVFQHGNRAHTRGDGETSSASSAASCVNHRFRLGRDLVLSCATLWSTLLRVRLQLCFLAVAMCCLPLAAQIEVTSGGNVGIGTNAPSALLVVDNSASTSSAGTASVLVQGEINQERIEIRSAGSDPVFQGRNSGGTVSSPSATTSGSSLAWFLGGGYTGSSWFNTAGMRLVAEELFSSTARGSSLRLEVTPLGGTSRVEAMRIAPSSNVGIGATDPQAPLHVFGQSSREVARFQGATDLSNYRNFISIYTTNSDYWWELSNQDPSGTGGLNGFAFRERSGSGNSIERVYFATGGNVGIGTTSPSSLLHVTGAVLASAYNTTSDARLKTNIRPLTNSGAVIDALQPRIFDWKSGEKDAVGFVAQELHEAAPYAVTSGDDDPDEITYQWAVDASKLVPVLTAEVKALRTRASEQEKDAQTLRAELGQQKSTTNALAGELAELRRELTALRNR